MNDGPERDEGDQKQRLKDRRTTEFQMRKGGHDHEWVLLTSRMAVFLTSQSLFATGATILFANQVHPWSILFISTIALVITFASSIGIAINCRVLSDWHIYMQELLEKDESDRILDGFYIPRHQPDFFHIISVDMVNNAIPLIGGTAWIVVINTILITTEEFGMNRVADAISIILFAVFWCIWVFFLVLIYNKGSLLGNFRKRRSVETYGCK